jgi:hypothetical protein
VVNSHSVILPEQRVEARTELYTFRLTPTCLAGATVPFPPLSQVR